MSPLLRGRSYRMPVVAAMVVGRDEQQLVSDQLTGVAWVRCCESVEALERVVSAGGVRAVLADLWDQSGTQALPTLVALRAQAPDIPLIACFRPTAEALQEVPAVLAARAEIGIVLRGLEHLGLAVRRLIGPPPPQSAAEVLVQRLVPAVPPPVGPFFTICALKASPGLRVATTASWLQTSRRTLERRLHQAKLPGAATVLGSMIGLHAAWWIDVQGQLGKQVVAHMGFPHPSSLTRLLRRHFNSTVSSLRSDGGFAGLLLRFEGTLRAGAHAG